MALLMHRWIDLFGRTADWLAEHSRHAVGSVSFYVNRHTYYCLACLWPEPTPLISEVP